MLNVNRRSVEIPRLLKIQCGAIGAIGPILSSYELLGSNVAVVSGSGATRAIGLSISSALGKQGALCAEVELDDYSVRGAKQLRALLVDGPADAVVAVGGGRVIDVAKVAASMLLPLVTVPTSLSHDGLCSPVASLPDAQGARQSIGASMPCGVVIDPEIALKTAPRSLLAGMGDLVSNLVAIEDWRMASQKTGEAFDDYAADVAEASALSVVGLTEISSARSAEALARGLVLSGLAMAMAGSSRPCSGSEHLISHALDAALGRHSLPHGYQVALGTAVMAEVHDRYRSEIKSTFARCGIPHTPEALGISENDVRDAIRQAPQMRQNRFSVLSELDTSDQALTTLMGRAFRQ